MHVVASLLVKEWTMLEDLADCRLKRLHRRAGGAYMASLFVRPKLVEFIIAWQQIDPFFQATVEKLHVGETPDFSLGVHGELRFDQRLYVPQYEEARRRLLDKAHRSKYTVHPGSTKMYRDLK